VQYNQPFDQPSNPNAPYIDGNPAAGIQGSIVPAASIEYPQREIMNALQAAGLVGTNADLTQLLQMLKITDVFNHFKVGINQGNASQWSCTIPTLPIMPPPLGCAIWFEPKFASVNGGTVFSVNGSAFAPVTNADLTPIGIGDVLATGWLLLFFDGTEWMIVAGQSARVSGVLPMLKANANWYVNSGSGDDVNHDGTSPTVGAGAIGPFRTIQRAVTETYKYNMNGYDQFINVADGAYTGQVILGQQNGAGTVHLVGNVAQPQNCAIAGNGSSHAVSVSNSYYTVDGFRLSAPGSGQLDGIIVGSAATCHVTALRFGACARYHMSCMFAALGLGAGGAGIVIEGGANANAHMRCESIGSIRSDSANQPPLTILGAVSIGAFVSADQLSASWVPYSSITGAAFVTGQKYSATLNSTIAGGTGNINYYPGSTAGSVATGGQYG
jgi:hypothetical protein